jgi:hypothetical protein
MRGDPPELPETEQVTVALTRREVDDLRRVLSLVTKASVERPSGQYDVSVEREADLLAHARRILESRKRRTDHFGRGIFGEPAWEMLLTLYTTSSGRRHTIARLSELSGGASRTTAIRWFEYLEREGLVGREPHPTDKRTDFVHLTEKGRQKLEAYLSETVANIA